MKVLWITNILFPEAEARIKNQKIDLKSSGGWLTSMAESLISTPNESVNLHVATVSELVDKLVSIEGQRITYWVLPYGKGNIKYNSEYEKFWKQINQVVQPDIVHIHGTEFSHGLAFVNACGINNVLVSIQGLTSEISQKYLGGLTIWDVLRTLTVKDILSGNNLLSMRRMYEKRAKNEISLLQKVQYACGRTTWDYACARAINPKIKYLKCGEIIRSTFYNGNWEFNKCSRYSIFISQSHYPLKGLHKLLKAVSILKKTYPNIVVNIAGKDITRINSFKDRIMMTGYGNYISRLIKKLQLIENIKFLGYLDSDQMKEQYLQCNVFVCPSSLENSPNSVAEAQLLGVPVIASFVGGIPDMIPSKEMGTLYPFDDVNLLAHAIEDVFENKSSYNGKLAQREARKRHDAHYITDSLLAIYNKFL